MWAEEWGAWSPGAGVDINSVRIAWRSDYEFTIFYSGTDPTQPGTSMWGTDGGGLWAEDGHIETDTNGRRIVVMDSSARQLDTFPEGAAGISSIERAASGGFVIQIEVPGPPS